MRIRILVFIAFIVCIGSAQVQADDTLTISVLGTNDVHGRVSSLPVFAGYVKNLRQARRKEGAVLLLDAGDMFQGTLESNMFEGEPVVRAYRKLGYTAVTLGNHEFDYGQLGSLRVSQPGDDPQGALRKRIAEFPFPVLSANLISAATKQRPAWKNLEATTIKTVRGQRIGIVGLLTEDTPLQTFPENFRGLSVAPLIDVAIQEAKKLRAQGAHMVIIVTHEGGGCKQTENPRDISSCDPNHNIFKLANRVPPGLVDLIVAGHHHKTVAHFVNGIPIIESLSYGRAFGRVDFKVDAKTHKILETNIFKPQFLCKSKETATEQCQTFEYEGQPVKADRRISLLLKPYLSKVRKESERPLNVNFPLALPLIRDEESTLGQFVVDAIQAASPEAEAAIINGGALRDGLPQGPLKYKDLYKLLPFDDVLVTLNLKVSELERAFTHVFQEDKSFLFISGLIVRAYCKSNQLTVEFWNPHGRKLKSNETVKVATVDYLALGGNNLIVPDPSRIPHGTILLRDAILSALKDPHRLSGLKESPSRKRVVYGDRRPLDCSAK